ncbi:hypothetical protein [Nocardiopsis ansamitocini]|uniref:Uncharacterized protein n=1 Tax=Nocardiopsis ansamitocini TaxID=1670832 RepID=A0A9W6UG75_9ACTN|nr:hypothetical protein [Nocardiopsis ansamitocini]GLU46741.1 hypothetical protein Nans01_10920 [Nocardiopsis ansamitocini]
MNDVDAVRIRVDGQTLDYPAIRVVDPELGSIRKTEAVRGALVRYRGQQPPAPVLVVDQTPAGQMGAADARNGRPRHGNA